jgi:hypothetical protein
MYKILLVRRPCMEALTNNQMLHSKHVLCSAHAANTLPTIKSTTTLHSQIHEIVHSNYIGFVLGASMYSNEKPTKNELQSQRIPGKHMKEKR